MSSAYGIYPHMPILHPHASRFHERRISSVTFLRRRISTVIFTRGWAWPRAGRFVRFWAYGGAKFTKMGDSLPWTPINRSAKLTPLALSSAEKSVTVQTNTQTVTDTTAHCLSACVDKKKVRLIVTLSDKVE